LLRRFGIDPVSEGEMVHSEEELRLIVTASQKEAGGMNLDRGLVLNALDLRRRIAREVMRPRQEITALDTEASIAECLETAEKTRYSRFPLCEKGDLDKTLGVVHSKDLFAMRLKARNGADLLPVARKLIFIPETAHLNKLLQHFLNRRLHLAMVVDEWGGTVGMVTLENVLEEIVGPIQDEFDQEKPLVTRTGEASWDLSGALPLHEFEELIGERLEHEGVTTVSGWLTQRLGAFPKPGETLKIGAYEIVVEEMDGPRVTRFTLRRRILEVLK
jgi:CBS domain containing-hemolysin-like protein